jgi:hypothetical protein
LLRRLIAADNAAMETEKPSHSTPTDSLGEIDRLKRSLADESERLSAERGRREAVEERLREARDEIRQQLTEMTEMQKVNGQLRGKLARLESQAKTRGPAKKSRRAPRP